jgi:hypothetical protein
MERDVFKYQSRFYKRIKLSLNFIEWSIGETSGMVFQ